MISLAIAALVLSGAPDAAQNRAVPPVAETRPSRVAESPVTQAARQWLALVDAAKWKESWSGTTQSFRSLNSVEAWQSASATARVPLGRVLSRRLVSEENIPAPPSGNQLVRFQTDFANTAGATETLSLAREDGSWKVVGIYIE